MFFHWTAGTLREKFANLFLSGPFNTDDVVNLYKRTGTDTLTEQALTWSPSTPLETDNLSVNPQGTLMFWNGFTGTPGSTVRHIRFYEFNNDTSSLTQQYNQNFSNILLDATWNPAFTDGDVLLVNIMTDSGANIEYWVKLGSTYTRGDVVINVAGLGYDPYADTLTRCKFNAQGTHLALAYGPNIGDQRLRIADRGGESFGEIFVQTSTAYSGLVREFDYSLDGSKFAVTTDSVPYVHVYNVTGTSYVKLPNTTFGTGNRPSNSGPVAWNQNATSLAVGDSSNPAGTKDIVIFNVSGDTFTKVATISVNGPVRALQWAQDGSELYVSTEGSPYFYIFSRVNNTFTSVGTLDPVYDQFPNRILSYITL
jgi:hypothetical protein